MKRLWYVLLAAVTVLCSTAQADALVRPLHRVRAAVHMAAPWLPQQRVRLYAKILRDEARARHFDPYTAIAMVKFESQFRANLVYEHGGEHFVGLGQVRLQNQPSCRNTLLSPACQQWKATLLDGSYNLKHVAKLITLNREMCRRRTGKPALFARWLSSYQGFNNSAGRAGVWCNMRKDGRGRWRDVAVPQHTQQVMNYRRKLLRSLR